MLLIKSVVGDVFINLTRDEIATAESFERLIQVGERVEAIKLYREWEPRGHGLPGRARRTSIGKALGLTHDLAVENADLLAWVRENRLRLDDCLGHRFNSSTIDWENGRLPERFECAICGGSLPALQAVAYAQGIAHAGADPDVVLPGFVR